MTRPSSWVALVDKDTGDMIELLDKNDSCEPYAGGDYIGHCGGCGMCMLMQADHSSKIELRPVGETFQAFNLQIFAQGLYEAFGDRSLDMSDDLYLQLQKLWASGVSYGRHGVPPVSVPDEPEDFRGALRQVIERKANP